ncbi:MAG: class I SAM-dependent rRNA methyltransferase [Phycisphaerae bacterium]|nr:class I SAM-dependent rRNA methyltransferase [Phycisphaerae bacterium]
MPDSGEWMLRLRAAVGRRIGVLERNETEVCRLVHGGADRLGGWFVDRYGPGLALVRHQGRMEFNAEPRAVAEELLRLLERFGVTSVYDKPFVRDRSRLGGEHDAALKSPTPIAGAPLPEAIEVREHGRTFEVRLYDGFSTGLFLDQRLNRSFLAEGAAGRRVLNTFCYTGGFSVACAIGGATTTSVDVSARYMEWAQRNFLLNSLDPGAHHFARMDTFDFLSMARRKGMQFDLVILDPPTFSAGDRKRGIKPWSAARDYGRLVAEASHVMAPAARLFASTNASELCEGDRLRRVIASAVPGVRWLATPGTPEDFPTGNECARWEMFSIS